MIIPNSFPKHFKNIQKSSKKHPRDMPKPSENHLNNIKQICQTYFKTCQKHANFIQKTTQNHANNTNTQPHSICRNGRTKLAFRATAFSFVPAVTNTDACCTQMAPCNVTVFIGAIVLVTFRFVACLREIRQFMRGVVQFIRTICVGSFQFIMAGVWFSMAGMGVKTFLKGTGGLQRFLIGVCVEAIWWPFRCIV
jgi:hypothetical protein